ncbi:aminotransferase class I/II-fold pyridoxal phosphate-dependent enzyme [Actinomycetota bacterium]
MTEQTAPRPLSERSPEELAAVLDDAKRQYAALQERGLKFDLTRGKPAPEQLDLSNDLLHLPTGHKDESGTDVRNYGGLIGLPAARELFAELLWVEPDQVVCEGNSSLTVMHDCIVDLLLHGAPESERPWIKEDKVKFLCPVPGYDRHFALLEHMGIEMVNVPMNDDGPDADECARIAGSDPQVKGMWVVPTYANPTGGTTTQEVASKLASMQTAAPDFRIFWDNAYAFHHLSEEEAKSADIITLCSAAGHPNRVLMFASTSKITFAGAGVAVLAASADNIAWYTEHLSKASIGPDKVNQLRHLEFFKDADGLRAHMAKHRDILAPKFAAVDASLKGTLDGLGIAEWSHPKGGYFVNLDVMDGTASRVVQLAKEAGIALTPAGASFPYGKDPRDRNIRLAPSFPSLAEVSEAMDGVAVCVLLAAAEQLTAGA